MNTPKQETHEQLQSRLKQEGDQRRIDYRFIFNSEKGQVILKDLRGRYGWRKGGDIESPSYGIGSSPADVAFIEGSKEVVRHILAMTEQETSTDPKSTRAINE